MKAPENKTVLTTYGYACVWASPQERDSENKNIWLIKMVELPHLMPGI